MVIVGYKPYGELSANWLTSTSVVVGKVVPYVPSVTLSSLSGAIFWFSRQTT